MGNQAKLTTQNRGKKTFYANHVCTVLLLFIAFTHEPLDRQLLQEKKRQLMLVCISVVFHYRTALTGETMGSTAIEIQTVVSYFYKGLY